MSRRLKAERLLPRRLLALVALALLGVLLAVWSEPADAATTFTVNKTGDGKDRKINGVCDASRKRGQQCTLRAAIQEANDTPGADKISFNIGDTNSLKTISPRSPLPDITEAVTINGYTQRGARANTQDVGNDAVLKIQLNGTNAGTGPEANGLVIHANDSTIKGLVINGFDSRGIVVEGFNTTGNKIQGNFLGTNAGGTAALGNEDGVDIQQADDTTVGGTVSGARNVISGNSLQGILIQALFLNPTGNKIEGNFIGTNASGNGALGNGLDGVQVAGADDNTVGGTVAGAGNRIGHNGAAGVSVIVNGAFGPEGATGNRVLSNSIFQNAGLGIDLGATGVTANDTKDPDTGANDLQNIPVIASAIRFSTGLTTISGTLNSNPNQNFTIQCFVAGPPDPSGHGEGLIPAGQTTAATNANGDGSFSCVSPIPQAGQAMTATATNTLTGDTSEFSQNVGVVAVP
jgi:CSLREA domain-containing protein